MIDYLKRIFPVALAITGLIFLDSPASAAAKDPEAPGDWRGYAFDTCRSPSISQMKTWWEKSEFKAVGIYTSGNSRACPTDGSGAANNPKNPNLTPSWVAQTAAMGWSFIPIHVGQQSPCYDPDNKRKKKRMSLDENNDGQFEEAFQDGVDDANEALVANKMFGFPEGSVIYLDIEGYGAPTKEKLNACHSAVLAFTNGWTQTLHQNKYRSGFYSSGGSGIKLLSNTRKSNPNAIEWPDHIWVARWSGSPSSGVDSYLDKTLWTNGQRIHQYTGGTMVTRSGVTINIDKNFMTVGKGSVASAEPKPCNVKMTWSSYSTLKSKSKDGRVKTLQCLLKEADFFEAAITGVYDTNTINAVKNYRSSKGWSSGDGKSTTRGLWTALLSRGNVPGVLKYGSTGEEVWRLQMSLNAGITSSDKQRYFKSKNKAKNFKVAITGIFDENTATAVKIYRKRVKMATYRTAEPAVWTQLQKGN